MMVRHKALCWK